VGIGLAFLIFAKPSCWQLILPESFKLFPVYALSFIKTKALKGGPVVSDVRTHYMRLIKSMGVADTMELLYPRMLPVHTITPDMIMPDDRGIIRLPRLMRTSYAKMEPHGAYLIRECGTLWIGRLAKLPCSNRERGYRCTLARECDLAADLARSVWR